MSKNPRKKKIRGLYSEIITDPDTRPESIAPNLFGAFKHTNVLWQVKTERHAPILQRLVKPQREIFLAPAERWITYEEEKHINFPVETFKPKVQLRHVVRPQELPRNVEIERRRKEYQKHSAASVLADFGIKPRDLLPVRVLKDHIPNVSDRFRLHSWVPYLSLDLFDDYEYDPRTADDWLILGIVDEVRYPIPAQAFLPAANKLTNVEKEDLLNNIYKWVNVAVLDYDKHSELWNILTLDGLQRAYQIPRIKLMFKAEDPINFGKRVKAALKLRFKTENAIRNQFIVDCMQITSVNIDPDMLDNIILMGVRNNPNKYKNKELLDQLKAEVTYSYVRTMGEINFRYVVQSSELNNFLKIYGGGFENPPIKPIIQTNMKNYKKARKFFGWYDIYCINESYRAMSLIVGECIKVESQSLFTQTLGAKYVSLDEFQSLQKMSSESILKQLRSTWLDMIVFNTRMCLGDVGKGWFDLLVKDFRVYLISKLYRFMELIKFRMQTTLRILVVNSITVYINMLETPCIPCLNLSKSFVWGPDWRNSPFKSIAPAIFSLTMKINEEGTYYSTPLENFKQVLLKIYDDAISETHYIKQVQPMILPNLRFAPDLFLSSLGLLSEEVVGVRQRFLRAYKKACIPLRAYANEYNKHLDLFNLSVVQYVEEYKNEEHLSSEVREEISFHLRMKNNLEQTIPSSIEIGPFKVNTDQIKGILINKRSEIMKALLDMFAARMKKLFIEILDEYKAILIKMSEKPTSIEHIFDIKDFIETIPLSIKTLEDMTRRYCLEYDVLDQFWYALPQEDFENKWEAIGWPFRMLKFIDQTEQFLLEETEKFYKIQLQDEIGLHEKIEAFTVQVVALSGIKDFSKVHETAVAMGRLWKAMKDAQEFGMLLNQRQKLFAQPVIPFEQLTKLMKEFEPYKSLWITASDWLRSHDVFIDNPLVNIDGDAIDRTVTEMYKTMVKLIKVFAEVPAAQTIAKMIRAEIDEFRPKVPLIQALRSPGMRDRHWELMRERTGIDIEFSPTLTFNECIQLGLEKFADVVIEISENASKEFSIEGTLLKMKQEWQVLNMDLTPYKETGTHIMKISEETQQLLDDHIVLTQQLSFSPFKGPFDVDIDEWEDQLKTTAHVVEEWMDVQKQWMYLEPIFASPDIANQLPNETKKYKTMERTWKRIIRNAILEKNIISYCSDRGLLESLRDCNHALQLVQKGLTEYLEVKRIIFPRLYFLSDDELLEILSQTRNVLAVQPHLRKCFENIARLTFESDLKITQMFSAEEECVDLEPTLYPEGSVEEWLLIVENSMKNTVRVNLGRALDDLYKRERSDWVLRWPGQIVIACSQTFWTAIVEEGILNNKLKYVFDNIILINLDALRGLVKGALTFLQREILSALIVIEVHSRDVTDTLVQLNTTNINDFDWISQLRYYWTTEQQTKVRAVNAEFQYGYEYLGNSGRLVITPLTDRCYLTLTGALHLKFGGAPAGPAGTGKTETTKDLAKAFAIQCVVFNCSDQLDFMAMGKFFKGLASSGAWACFDEFNRIDIEVLSVVAQQITTIQKAQQARLDRFIFEGTEIALKESCAVFITMNPGYAGRTELPDNLKALFRPVSMMVPNYTLIAEISLFSFGFSNARQLANKITTTFKLSSEQLSSQDHYDFGMRAVKTVIAVAGNLKREKPNMDERQIVLRSLRDVNVPKFLKDDLKLFNGIVSDLFPRMEEEAVDYGILEEGIRAACIKLGYLDVDDYVKKVIQLYETTVVRHGLMLVGPTGSGKTKCYCILQKAMTSLKGQLQPSGYPFQPVQTYVMNPKSITMGQLYGEFDLQTHEWTDGILPCLVRVGINADDKDKRWYIFDGPVDAVWIENMNTVLDDNKKLCLSSGEIIKLKDTMTMMFEVADLAVASPATVSRCGMVYLEPGVLGLEPFVTCWIKTLPPLVKDFADDIHILINIYVLPAITIVRNEYREILTSVDSCLLQGFFRLMGFRFGPLIGRDNKPPPPQQFLDLIPVLLVPWVIFSVIWSVGATCDYNGRLKFDRFIRSTAYGEGHKPAFPTVGLVYDYRLHDGGFTDTTSDGEPAQPRWINWMTNIEEYKITHDTKYSDIEVPTIDNVRNAEMIGMILTNENNVLSVGPTGTGKTLTVIAKLSKNMHKKFISDFICFSARTSAKQTQDLIDGKLDRRRKGVYGPPVMKRQIFFIDDFNMPALEVFGAQPPIELIRQWMDFNGWYDKKNIGDFRTIIDVNFVAAMGPPGGGRNPITARLLRHFHYVTFLEMEDDSKRAIFGTILRFWISRTHFDKLFEPILNSTLEVYLTILKELLPTPAKTHYTFNLRDLSKVFQGLLMFEAETFKNVNEIIRLWYHENCRVFQDRLVNDEDRVWFDDLLKTKIDNNFNISPVILGRDMILFGDFLDPTVDNGPYVQIKDLNTLYNSLNHYLEEHNSQSTRPMKLVLFLDAMSHVCRISRIIRQPMGNALLLGMGGSGRQSLTRLSAFIAEYNCFQIELSKTYGNNEWKEDLKGIMLKAGLYLITTVFLFSDTQIKTEAFLEDLNNILNSGDVPNIYQPEELDKIYQGMKGAVQEAGLQATKSNLFSFYTKQVRSSLHTVLTMSPIGEVFRARLRQFPALVNCCTIDWFCDWPDSALQSVAKQFMLQIDNLNISMDGLVNVFQYMHASVVRASLRYKAELSRTNYVTPTSYLELLTSYIQLLTKKRGTLTEGVGRLKIGLQKMQVTQQEIKVLQEQLIVMKPALEIAAKDAEVMIAQIAKDTIVAEETKAAVEKEEEAATKKAEVTEVLAADAQKDLDEALPELIAAENSLKSLNKNDVTEVKAMKRPPVGVVTVMEAICIVKNIKPIKVPGLKFGEKINDYWEPARGILSDPGVFLNSLMNFDKESITQEMVDKLAKYVTDPNFTPAKISKVSKACTSLCMWIHAMYKYYFVNQKVVPKKAALAEAKAELERTQRALAIAKKRMALILEGLANLQEKLNAKIAFKNEKEQSIQICEERMNRAVRLIAGLSGEKVRWVESINQIEANVVNVTGDILISAGCVAYLTPFTDDYRKTLFNEWLEVVKQNRIPFSPNCNPVQILGEQILIRSWQIDGLPRDSFSTENAVLVSCSRRWPLFIDPQGQANKWIKNMGKTKSLFICKLSDKDLMRTMESAIRFGKPVLIENVGTELDPALDPVLMRSTFVQSGTVVIKLGEITVPYDDNFRLYITTKLPNPSFSPELSIKVLVVNFTLVPSGLQDQLLALVVMQERPDLEELRSNIVVSMAQMKNELKEIEDRILYKLSISEGSPLDDLDFIITLEASKITCDDIKNKVESSEITQIDIDNTRALYIPVANRAQILFFCLADLSNVDPMYQYSLEWFISIFTSSMSSTPKSENISERVQTINDHFTFSLYLNVCRSLFEKHKLLFAFLLSVRIMMNAGKIDPQEWRHFLAGGSPLRELSNPAPDWLSSKSWSEILALEACPNFVHFVISFSRNIGRYKAIFESTDPHRQPFPPEVEGTLNQFQSLLVLKCLRPDKVSNAMQDFLANNLGQRFIEPQSSDLSEMFKESSPAIPLIFVLSAGTDPAAELYKFAERMKFGKRFYSISLGQGQGPRAEHLIEVGVETGNWVFFQNCHLAPSWMPRLERILENVTADNSHRDFRIWLTSIPSPYFPVAILQNGSKMTVEPPAGIKANMLRAYLNQVSEYTDFIQSEHQKALVFKLLIFSLCLFHGVLLERRKFGPLGFNIPYEFTDGDLKICISQLHMFLLEYTDIPFKVLTYTAGHINYGGRVTDDWDRRCLMNVLSDYYNVEVVDPQYVFDSDEIYHQLHSEAMYLDYLDYIKTFPINDNPELFGLHPNADITYAQTQTYRTLATLLLLQPKTSGAAASSQEEVTTNLARSILENLPREFELEIISKRYPVLYEESLNTVIIQEAIRYNRLLVVIKSSLNDLLKAMKGLVVLSESLERMSGSLFTNMVPQLWATKAYPSLKPLGAWVLDLNARCRFLQNWVREGIPPAFWISGFYFPQAFLTGTLQNFARKYIVSIDTINFKFKVLGQMPKIRPDDGCCVYGLFLEGARWNPLSQILDESNPKELYTDMPVVWFLPEENHVRPSGTYECPVYKTLTRAGTLSTTGHSTNYVVAIEVPSKKSEKHWIKRGVALICALDY